MTGVGQAVEGGQKVGQNRGQKEPLTPRQFFLRKFLSLYAEGVCGEKTLATLGPKVAA